MKIQFVIYTPDRNYKNCSSNNFDKCNIYSVHVFYLPKFRFIGLLIISCGFNLYKNSPGRHYCRD